LFTFWQQTGEDGHVRGDEVLPTRAMAPFQCWCDAVALQDISDRLIGKLMAEIGECASDAFVTPAFVLLGNADDERFDCRADAPTSRVMSAALSRRACGAIRRRYGRRGSDATTE
jgi:hypothetical protein